MVSSYYLPRIHIYCHLPIKIPSVTTCHLENKSKPFRRASVSHLLCGLCLNFHFYFISCRFSYIHLIVHYRKPLVLTWMCQAFSYLYSLHLLFLFYGIIFTSFFLKKKKKIKTQHDKQTKPKQLQLYPSKNYYPLVSNLNGVPFLYVSLTLCENILHCIYNVLVLLFTSYYYKVLLFACSPSDLEDSKGRDWTVYVSITVPDT